MQIIAATPHHYLHGSQPALETTGYPASLPLRQNKIKKIGLNRQQQIMILVRVIEIIVT